MHTLPSIRKVFQGVATRHEMHRMFNRHRGNPACAAGDTAHLFAGEWFEIAETEHDRMLEILPPRWMRDDMFAMREFMVFTVTSVFVSLSIDGRRRWFHGHCIIDNAVCKPWPNSRQLIVTAAHPDAEGTAPFGVA